MTTRSMALLTLLLLPPVFLGFALNFNPGPAPDLEVRNRNSASFSILPKFEAAGDFHEGLAPVRQNQQWGYVDSTGDWVIKPQFQAARPFREGRAAVRTSRGWGYVDTSGDWIVDPAFKEARSFHEGRAAVRGEAGWSFITRNGRVITSFQYSWVDRFRNGRAVVSRGRTKGYLDRSGDTVLGPFTDAGAFGEKWAPARSRTGWGYVDRDGGWVVSGRYDWASTPREGLARVRRGDQWYVLEVETGETEPVPGSFVGEPNSRGLIPNRRQGRVGYLDAELRQRIEPRFDQGLAFRKGLAPVKKGGLWGYVDTAGDWVIRPKFNAAGPFVGDHAPVKIGAQWGYIPHPGRTLGEDVHQSDFWVDTGIRSVEPSQLNESLVDQFPTWRYQERDLYVRVLGTSKDHWIREPLVPQSNFGRPNAKYEVTRYPYEQPNYLQLEAAEQFFWRSLYVAQKRNWFSARTGLKAGFGLGDKGGVDSHYFKEAHMLDGKVLVPEHPESLIYYGKQASTAMLGGIMFYHTEPTGSGPQIGGPLTPWHYHVFDEPVCHEGVMVRPFEDRCENGEFRTRSPEMIHTWFIDHPHGSFATATDLVEDRENTFNLAFNPAY